VFSTIAQYGTECIKAINEALVKAILSVVSIGAIVFISIAKSISDASNKSLDEVYKSLTETISNVPT
jgi:hypothetical protein